MNESERGDIVTTSVERTAEAAAVIGMAGKSITERLGKTTEVFLSQHVQKVLERRHRK